jgi:DNA-binding transcriptional MerR regulator
LDYWDETGVVSASLCRGRGKGKGRAYSYTDLVKLSLVRQLRESGLSLQRIRKAIGILKGWSPGEDPLAHQGVITDGDNAYVMTSDGKALKGVLDRGQLSFLFVLGNTVSAAVRRIDAHIEKREAAAG